MPLSPGPFLWAGKGPLPLVLTEGPDGSPLPPVGESCQQAFQNAKCSVRGLGRSEGQRGEEGSWGVPHRGNGLLLGRKML